MEDNYLDKINNLKGWYKNKFDIVNNYCSILLEDVDDNTRNNIMFKIISDFLNAQDNKIPISNIIGDNIEDYCEKECGKNLPLKYKLKFQFDIFKYWAIALIVFNGSELILKYEKNNFFDIKTETISFFLTIVLCFMGGYIYRIINLHSVRKKAKDILLKIFLPLVISILLIFASIYFPYKYQITIHIWLEVLICLDIFILHKIIYRSSKKDKMYFIELAIKQEISDSKKMYEKLSRKNSKKNKKNISEKEYIDKRIDKAKTNLKYNKIYLICPVIFSIIPTLVLLFYNNIIDTILFFVAIYTIELIIFIPIYRSSKKFNICLIEKYEFFKKKKIHIKDWK